MVEADKFINGLTPEAAAQLEEAGRLVRFQPGAILYNEGDRSDRVAVVVSGRVKVSRLTPDGKEVLLAIREAGDLIGELAALDGGDHSATAAAMEPVELRLLSASEFKSFLTGHPSVAVSMLTMLSRRLREADEKRAEYSSHDAAGRVARRLVELALLYGDSASGDSNVIRLTQEELASYTAASREAVSKALQSLKAKGVIETVRRGVVIKDLEALRRRAGL